MIIACSEQGKVDCGGIAENSNNIAPNKQIISTDKITELNRSQVMIEAMLVEIKQTESQNFGIQWVAGSGNNTSTSSSLKHASVSIPSGIALGKSNGTSTQTNLSSTTTVSGQMVLSLTQLANMISSNNVGNIVSRLTLVTVSNEEAEITIGSDINTLADSKGQQCKIPCNTSRTLQVKPIITQNGVVKLNVYFEDSAANLKFRTTLLVNDGQIIASNEVVGNKLTFIQKGVPGLSKVPYIGKFFSWQKPVYSKVKFILFLRPVIINKA